MKMCIRDRYLNEQKSVLHEIIASWRNIESDGIAVVSKGQEYIARSDKDVAEIASTIMMNSYPRTIIVNNDLINKNTVSGAIRLARTKALSYIMNNKDNMPVSYTHLKTGISGRTPAFRNHFGKAACI